MYADDILFITFSIKIVFNAQNLVNTIIIIVNMVFKPLQ